MEPFGVRFGRLVRDKRAIEGLSQDGLAEKSELTKPRISDIETGKIKNPQAKTVDALCVALNISREERAACHPGSMSSLPSRLLEKLARNFGQNTPGATEEELEAFLMAKAEELREMREGLKEMAETEGRLPELIKAANAALGEGDVGQADDLLREAEAVQLQSGTIAALKKQAELRAKRGKVALVDGDIEVAAGHFEQSSRYFSGVDAALEAGNRHEYATLLRGYGYRYKSCDALYAARTALQHNLGIWKKDTETEKWCQTKNALGGVSFRLSQFDVPEHAMLFLADAKINFEDVRALCSENPSPRSSRSPARIGERIFGAALGKIGRGIPEESQSALSLQLSTLRLVSKASDPTSWGILQHNLGCSYIHLSNTRHDEAKSAADIENAIRHLKLSFEVRNPDESLQFWLASCRSLGEALLNMSTYTTTGDAAEYVSRASEILNGAAARISSSKHPLQWAEIQEQLERCGERRSHNE